MIRIETFWKDIWLFIRGDFPAKDFESWIYQEKRLEEILGEEFYFELISLDFSNTVEIYVLRKKLVLLASEKWNEDCHCITSPNLAGVGMGDHERIFETLEERASYGQEIWWLHLRCCSVCQQWWLVASEERINDVYLMKRLSSEIAQKICNENLWPKDFHSYADLLSIGRDLGHKVSFVDPLDSSLVITLDEIAKTKPDINVVEIAELFQVKENVALKLYEKVIINKDVKLSWLADPK